SSRRSGSSSKTAAPSASSTSRHFATTKGMSSSSSRRAARAQPTSWSSRTRDTSSSTSAVYTQLGCGFNGRGTDATWSRSRTPGTAWHQRPDRRQRVRSRTVVHDRVEVPDVRDAEGEFVVAQPYRRAHHDAVQLHDPPAALVGKAVLYRPQGHAVKPRVVSDRDPALYTNPPARLLVTQFARLLEERDGMFAIRRHAPAALVSRAEQLAAERAADLTSTREELGGVRLVARLALAVGEVWHSFGPGTVSSW